MTPEEIIARAVRTVQIFDWHPCFVEIKSFADLEAAGYEITEEKRSIYRAMISAVEKG